jgi:hypothetical protein
MSSQETATRLPAQLEEDGCHPMDHTGRRILAYLASVQAVDGGAVFPNYGRGRCVMEHMALSAKGSDMPTLRLSAEDCADVLYFVQCSTPIEPRTWWDDPKGAPSQVVGFSIIMGVLEESLRGRGA